MGSLSCAAAIVILLLSSVSSFAAPAPTVTARHEDSVRGEIDGISFLVLRGSIDKQGEAHGVLAARDILTVLDGTLIPQVEKRPGMWDAGILPMVRTFAFPDRYAAELDGMLKGIRIALPTPEERTLTTLGREVSIDDLRALSCVGDIMSAASNMSSAGCSSFSAWGPFTSTGAIISGRNLDYGTFPGKIPFGIIARGPAEPGRLATLDLTAPGTVGVSTAMNAEGIVLLVHDEDGLPIEKAAGYTPRPLVSRDALEQIKLAQKPDEIAELFSDKKVITGNNTHIVFPSRNGAPGPHACVVEWDGNPAGDGAAIRLPDPELDSDALLCTNHYLERRDAAESEGGTLSRMASLVEAVGTARTSKTTIGVEEAKRMMDAVAVRGEGVTYLTAIAFPDEKRFIFATTPDTGVPATEGRWIEVNWDAIFAAQ